MIYAKGKPTGTIVMGKVLGNLTENRLIAIVIRSGKIVWQNIRSCFGKGYWISDKPWLNDDTWKS